MTIEKAFDMLINSKNIHGDVICASIVSGLTEKPNSREIGDLDKENNETNYTRIKELLLSFGSDDDYKVWNETSLGNALMIVKAVPNDKELQTYFRNKIKNYLTFVYNNGIFIQNPSKELQEVYTELTTQQCIIL